MPVEYLPNTGYEGCWRRQGKDRTLGLIHQWQFQLFMTYSMWVGRLDDATPTYTVRHNRHVSPLRPLPYRKREGVFFGINCHVNAFFINSVPPSPIPTTRRTPPAR